VRRSGTFHLLVVQRRLIYYRVPFFDALKHVLAEKFTKIQESEKFGMKEELEEHSVAEKYRDYVLLESYLIHMKLLDRINLELEKPGVVNSYADAVKVFESFGLDSSLYYPVLEYLRYKVIWTGLSEETAKVKRA
jgi:hypothetical protein